MSEIDQVTATVSRRLSQINEADLFNILNDGDRSKFTEKETKLNPEAAEFVPSFEAPRPYYPPQAQEYGYYDPNGYYYNQNAYYGYYPYDPAAPNPLQPDNPDPHSPTAYSQ